MAYALRELGLYMQLNVIIVYIDLFEVSTYLNDALGVLKKRAIDERHFEDHLMLLVGDKRIAATVIRAGHLVAIGIDQSTTCLIYLNARESLLNGGQNLSIRRGGFVRQIAFEFLNVQIELGLAVDHVSGADDGVSWLIRAHRFALHVLPGARLVRVQVQHNFAIDRFAVGVTEKFRVNLLKIIFSDINLKL